MKERVELFIPQIESSVKVSGGVGRRQFLRTASTSAAALAFPSALGRWESGASTNLKSCILIVMVGGPSHLDTFDMKPDSPSEVRGPFRPIKTNVAGIEVSEIFPRTAKLADKFALVRSLHHDASADHGTGLHLLETGSAGEDSILPSLGCVVSRNFPNNHGIPTHARLPGTPRRLGEGLRIRDLDDSSNISTFAQNDHWSPDPAFFEGSSRLEGFDADRYGDSRFGRSCQLAKDLVTRGVRFVTIDMFDSVVNEVTWDIHGSRPFSPISCYRDIVGPMFDRAYSSLLADLHHSGLLETTLVVATGEFGRTPLINPSGGRDHWPHCWTALFAGGGVKGGQIIGESDRTGAYVRERPTTAGEVIATIYSTLGIDYRTGISNARDEHFPIVPEGAKPISELF